MIVTKNNRTINCFFRNILAIILFFVISLNVIAQQDISFSQYMFNHFIINPAYAGSKDNLTLTANVREQWLKIKDAPSTQVFSAVSSLKNKEMGLGFNVINDNIGPRQTTSFGLSYAYHIKFKAFKLALGLRGGLVSSKLNWDKLSYKDANDPLLFTSTSNSIQPKFDAGLYLYTYKGFISAGITHLNKVIQIKNIAAIYDRHLYIVGSRAFEINKNFILNPSFLIKTIFKNAISYDINCNVNLKKVLWIGATYKNDFGFSFLAQYAISQNFKAGYSIDVGAFKFGKYSGVTHEINLNYNIDLFKRKSQNPRFL